MDCAKLRKLFWSDGSVRKLLSYMASRPYDTMVSNFQKLCTELQSHGLTKAKVDAVFCKLDSAGAGVYHRFKQGSHNRFSWHADMGARVVALIASGSLKASLYELIQSASSQSGTIRVRAGSKREADWLKFGLACFGMAADGKLTNSKFDFDHTNSPKNSSTPGVYSTSQNLPTASGPQRDLSDHDSDSPNCPIDYACLANGLGETGLVSIDIGPRLPLILANSASYQVNFRCDCDVGSEHAFISNLQSQLRSSPGASGAWNLSSPDRGNVEISSPSNVLDDGGVDLGVVLGAMERILNSKAYGASVADIVLRFAVDADPDIIERIESAVWSLIPCMRLFGLGASTNYERQTNRISVRSAIPGAIDIDEIAAIFSLWTSTVLIGRVDERCHTRSARKQQPMVYFLRVSALMKEDVFRISQRNGIYLPRERIEALHKLRARGMQSWQQFPIRLKAWQENLKLEKLDKGLEFSHLV